VLTDVGEYLVGACLQLLDGCEFVDYNVRPPGGGLNGLGELDVVGFNFATKTAIVCEVTTHIRGLSYVNNQETVIRLIRKHERQKAYATKHLTNFENLRFQFCSPVVPVGYMTNELAKLDSLELVINGAYKQKVDALRTMARTANHDARNPVFRMLQILEHLRG
jgi:hypothetical protein